MSKYKNEADFLTAVRDNARARLACLEAELKKTKKKTPEGKALKRDVNAARKVVDEATHRLEYFNNVYGIQPTTGKEPADDNSSAARPVQSKQAAASQAPF